MEKTKYRCKSCGFGWEETGETSDVEKARNKRMAAIHAQDMSWMGHHGHEIYCDVVSSPLFPPSTTKRKAEGD